MIRAGSFAVHDTGAGHHVNTPRGKVQLAPPEMHDKYLRTMAGAGEEHELYRHATEADGSCFFHAVCSALNIGSWHSKNNKERVAIGRRFRSVVRTVLTADSWDDFWKDKLKRDGLLHKLGDIPDAKKIAGMLDDPRVWADVYLISWAMLQLDISCLFFDQQSGSTMYCGVRGQPDATTNVLIQWVGHVHFEPLFLYNKNTKVMETSFGKGHAFIKHLHDIYRNKQCPNAKIAITV
jgi:hypothetical protein